MHTIQMKITHRNSTCKLASLFRAGAHMLSTITYVGLSVGQAYLMIEVSQYTDPIL